MSLISKRVVFGALAFSFFMYSYFVYTTGTAIDKGENLMNEASKKGKLVFQKYNCIACHQIYGLGGYMGPDITNVISENGKGAIYAKAFLTSGTKRMPNLHLSEDEINELLAYLTYIDKTGISPVKRFKINYDGTVSQN